MMDPEKRRAVAAAGANAAHANATGKPKQRRGFAAMDAEKQRAIARAGGKASHASGNGHEFSSEEASAAAKKSHAAGSARNR